MELFVHLMHANLSRMGYIDQLTDSVAEAPSTRSDLDGAVWSWRKCGEPCVVGEHLCSTTLGRCTGRLGLPEINASQMPIMLFSERFGTTVAILIKASCRLG